VTAWNHNAWEMRLPEHREKCKKKKCIMLGICCRDKEKELEAHVPREFYTLECQCASVCGSDTASTIFSVS
jgi:hypothetical protein